MTHERERRNMNWVNEYRASFKHALYMELIRAAPRLEVEELLKRVICEPDENGTFRALIHVGLDKKWRTLITDAVTKLPHVGEIIIVAGNVKVDWNTENEAPRNYEQSTPPQLGERLLLLVLRTKEERANIPGDLEEEFKQIAAKHGARYAKLWYYKQVAASAWPLIRKAVGWGMMASIGAWIRGRL